MSARAKQTKIIAIILAVLAVCMTRGHAQTFLTNGLVAYFPFNGNANDASGNNNNGTLFGAATFGVDRFGNPNGCLSLPGGSGGGSGVNVPSLTGAPLQPLTYSAWFWLSNYPPAGTAFMPLLGRVACGNTSGGTICIAAQALEYFTGSPAIAMQQNAPLNAWCQVVYTLDASGNSTFYLNGINAPTVGSGAGASQAIDFCIGAASGNGCGVGGDFFVWDGLIDDVRVYNRSLSATEIQQLYQFEAPPCQGGAAATGVITNGFVVGAKVVDGGCGYTNTPQVLIEGGGGTNAAAIAVVSNETVVQIIVTDAGSNYTSLPNIFIGGAPSIATQPQSLTVNAGDPASFNVTAFGSELSYQWLDDGTNIPGATLQSLVFTNVVQTNLGTYVVVVSNVFGSVTSSNAVLSMTPFLTDPFGGLETLADYTNTLTVDAWGSGPLSYQWFDDGVAIGGATDSTLTFTGILPTNSGIYTVVVSNSFGSVTNPPAEVVVEPAGVSLGLFPGLTITGVVGQDYLIQRVPDLSETNWTTVANLTLTQPVQIWVDTNLDASQPANPAQYYRVLLGP